MRYVFKFNEINDFLVNQILEGLKFNFPLFIIKKKASEKILWGQIPEKEKWLFYDKGYSSC